MIAGIVVALPDELDTLTSIVIEKGTCVAVADKLLVVYSGAGEKNAHKAAELLIAKGATCLMSWGCAAGLDQSLKPGDLVLANILLDADRQRVNFDVSWHQYSKLMLQKSLKVLSGCLLESKELVSSSDEKKSLHLATNATVLDMESVAVAKVAVAHQLPFLAVRAVADPVTMSLPKAVQHALTPQGDIVLRKLGWFLVCHPSEIVGLIKLALHFSAAKKTLSKVAKQLDVLLQFK